MTFYMLHLIFSIPQIGYQRPLIIPVLITWETKFKLGSDIVYILFREITLNLDRLSTHMAGNYSSNSIWYYIQLNILAGGFRNITLVWFTFRGSLPWQNLLSKHQHIMVIMVCVCTPVPNGLEIYHKIELWVRHWAILLFKWNVSLNTFFIILKGSKIKLAKLWFPPRVFHCAKGNFMQF